MRGATATRWIAVIGTLAVGSALLVSATPRRQTPHAATRPIRPAGPDAMRVPPKDWHIVDDQSDQSFPASDPPGGY